MTLPSALAVALAPTRKAIHALGYANSDDALERAARRLAEEVGRYRRMRCEACAARSVDLAYPEGWCYVVASDCRRVGGGCLAFKPRAGDEP